MMLRFNFQLQAFLSTYLPYTNGKDLELVGESVCLRKSSLKGLLLYAKPSSTVRSSGIEMVL